MARLSAVILSLFLAGAFAPVLADPAVDINTATAAELAAGLDGVGPAKAAAIVAHRDKFGPFTAVDELRYVKGIGAATVERNRAQMTVGTELEADAAGSTAVAER